MKIWGWTTLREYTCFLHNLIFSPSNWIKWWINNFWIKDSNDYDVSPIYYIFIYCFHEKIKGKNIIRINKQINSKAQYLYIVFFISTIQCNWQISYQKNHSKGLKKINIIEIGRIKH